MVIERVGKNCIVSLHTMYHCIEGTCVIEGSLILRVPGTSPLQIWGNDYSVYISYNRLRARYLLVALPTKYLLSKCNKANAHFLKYAFLRSGAYSMAISVSRVPYISKV